MRTLTGTDIAALAGHWAFAYLEVTDDTGAFYNLGALAVGTTVVDFFNTATVSESIDSNTLSFSATMKREVGTASLSPLRTDSLVNVSGATPGTYSPRLDLHREWRIMSAIMPRGVTPAIPTDYTELAAGIVDKVTIDGLAGTITVTGRGMEADLLDAFVVDDRPYTGAMETVIQTALNDQMGTSVVSLYTPVSPSFTVDDTIGDINLMPALSDIAALAGFTLRYRYDSANANRFTLFNPPRSSTTPDWSIASTEYEDLTGDIDLTNVRNLVVVRYANATAGVTTVVSPGAESGTVSCSGGVATFTASQAGVLADGAIIVVDRSSTGTGDFVGYVVSAFNGTTGCTLAAAPNFSGKQFYTSASIALYGLRVMVVDLSTGSQITDATAAGNLADAVRSDLEDPALIQTFKAPGLWFVQLHDVVTTTANGVHYDTDQTGGVTGYSHEFADGMLVTTVSTAGSVKGRYATWKRIGSGAAASAVAPTVLSSSATFVEAYTGGLSVAHVDVVVTVNDATRSVLVALYDDPAVTGPATELAQFSCTSAATGAVTFSTNVARGTVYYALIRPYSGPIDINGDCTGTAGADAVANTNVLPAFVNSSTVTFNLSTPGQVTADVIPDAVAPLPAFVDLTDGATVTWATAGAEVSNARLTLGGSRTLAITGAVNGSSGELRVTQGGAGSFTLSLPAGSRTIGGTFSLSTAVGAMDVLAWSYDGSIYTWVTGLAFA
jgi:hypothetical protein